MIAHMSTFSGGYIQTHPRILHENSENESSSLECIRYRDDNLSWQTRQTTTAVALYCNTHIIILHLTPVDYGCRRNNSTQSKTRQGAISFRRSAVDAKCQTIGTQRALCPAKLGKFANQQPDVVVWLAEEHREILICRIPFGPANSSETPYNQVILHVYSRLPH